MPVVQPVEGILLQWTDSHRAGKRAQPVKCLPYEYEDPNLNLRIYS